MTKDDLTGRFREAMADEKRIVENEAARLLDALTAWEAAQAALRAACERGETEQGIQAYGKARKAWIDAQCSVPQEQRHAAFLEALRMHLERKAAGAARREAGR